MFHFENYPSNCHLAVPLLEKGIDERKTENYEVGSSPFYYCRFRLKPGLPFQQSFQTKLSPYVRFPVFPRCVQILPSQNEWSQSQKCIPKPYQQATLSQRVPEGPEQRKEQFLKVPTELGNNFH